VRLPLDPGACRRLGYVRVQRQALSRQEVMFLVGVPLAWAILLLFHPGGEADTIYRNLQDEVTRALVVHVGMLLFIPMMAIAVYLLLSGVEGTAARVGRISLVPFVVFYSAYETLQGTANAVLVNEINGRPELEPGTRAELVQDFAEHALVRDFGVFAVLGTLGLIVALIAAGMALHRHAGAPRSVAVLLGVSGFLITAHPPPYGPTGLALFIAAVLLFVRSQSAAQAPAPVRQPGPA
jgi:hypothetical protein